ncbi:DHHC palmitoyltransferase-domain-containing protein [Lipomyces kononenkoae]|uniref:DHHC palmitoyltransferase-domain-containing protein n=1 Tax=Lipomyces kononenkoae TaxID=34357 RepID=A0ACC3T8N5_LIPKO
MSSHTMQPTPQDAGIRMGSSHQFGNSSRPSIDDGNDFRLARLSSEVKRHPRDRFFPPSLPEPAQITLGRRYTLRSDDGVQSNAPTLKGKGIWRFLPRRADELSDDEWRLRKRRQYRITKIVPVVLLGTVGYAAYVYCYLFAYHSMISSDGGSRKRKGIAFIVVFIYLAVILIAYCAAINFVGPGLVPRGWGKLSERSLAAKETGEGGLHTEPSAPAATSRQSQERIRGITPERDLEKQVNGKANDNNVPEAFICESDGYPLWCSRCQSVKPDRAHHSSELDRCVIKMDHYCPWVGAIIGFKNYKLFYLFVVTCFSFTTFVFVTLTIYTAIYANERGHVTAQFVVIDALSGVFAALLVPFVCMHTFYILENITTIEYLGRHYRLSLVSIAVDEKQPELRGITETEFGMKLWDCGPWQNWKSVMGNHIWEWVLPWNTTEADGFSFQWNPKELTALREKVERARQSNSMDGPDSVYGPSGGRFMVMRSFRM